MQRLRRKIRKRARDATFWRICIAWGRRACALRKVRTSEKSIILAGAAILIALLLFPPWRFVFEVTSHGSVVKNDSLVGHHSIFSPPQIQSGASAFTTTHIDFARLAILALAVMLVGATALWWIRSNPKSRTAVVAPIEDRSNIPKSASRRLLLLVTASVLLELFAYFLIARSNATFGYHTLSFALKLTGYSVCIAVVAVLMAAFGKRTHFKALFLSCFSWLLLAATGFDAVVAGYRVFVLIPRIKAALEQSATAPQAPAQNPVPQLVPPIELSKIKLSKSGDAKALSMSIYNGSDYTVHEIVVEVTDWERIPDKDADEEVEKHRAKRLRVFSPDFQAIVDGKKGTGMSLSRNRQEILLGEKVEYKVLERRKFRLRSESVFAEAAPLQTSYWKLDLGYVFGEKSNNDLSIEIVSATGLLEAAK